MAVVAMLVEAGANIFSKDAVRETSSLRPDLHSPHLFCAGRQDPSCSRHSETSERDLPSVEAACGLPAPPPTPLPHLSLPSPQLETWLSFSYGSFIQGDQSLGQCRCLEERLAEPSPCESSLRKMIKIPDLFRYLTEILFSTDGDREEEERQEGEGQEGEEESDREEDDEEEEGL
jgi:hypothetical protein